MIRLTGQGALHQTAMSLGCYWKHADVTVVSTLKVKPLGVDYYEIIVDLGLHPQSTIIPSPTKTYSLHTLCVRKHMYVNYIL